MNAWGVVVIVLGAGLLYWAAKASGSLTDLVTDPLKAAGGAVDSGTNKVAKAVTTDPFGTLVELPLHTISGLGV